MEETLKAKDTNASLYQSRAESCLARLSGMNWFASCGTVQNKDEVEAIIGEIVSELGLGQTSVRWIRIEELPGILHAFDIAASPIWPQLARIPSLIKDTAVKEKAQFMLTVAADDIPEKVFHLAYDGAFHAFGAAEEHSTRYAVSAAIYVAGLYSGLQIIKDGLAGNANCLEAFVRIFECGHWPLGVFNGQFYAI